MRLPRIPLVVFVMYVFCGTATGQGVPQKLVTTYVVPPANITATPLPFGKGKLVSFTASLVAPQK
jgi:hypothetical protein